MKTEWEEVGMQNLTYTSHDLRGRRNSNRWETILSHTDPVMDEVYALSFSVDQLKAMLAAAEKKEVGHGVFRIIWRFVRRLFRVISRWM